MRTYKKLMVQESDETYDRNFSVLDPVTSDKLMNQICIWCQKELPMDEEYGVRAVDPHNRIDYVVLKDKEVRWWHRQRDTKELKNKFCFTKKEPKNNYVAYY